MKLKSKLEHTKELIRCWVDSWGIDSVYVSFSGGLDSTVLLGIARKLYPEMKGVFCNTGLEFPEIVSFVKTFENIDIIRPKMPFHQVIEKYGYPVISKEQSQYIYVWRNTKSAYMKDLRWNGRVNGRSKISEKWKFMAEHAPFKISDMCCQKLKKDPFKIYEKQTGRWPILGVMSSESSLRHQSHICNLYDTKRPISKPLNNWTKADIVQYIEEYNVEYSKIYDMGYDRTGCIWCLYGVHANNPNKIQQLAKTHPRLHKYCIEKLEIGSVMDFMGLPFK